MAAADQSDLKELDRQIAEAVKFCTKSGFSKKKVQECAEPVLSWISRKRWQRRLRLLLILSIIIGMLAVIWQSETCFRWFCIACKLLQLKLLPYWDWTQLYGTSCVISNPYYQEDTITDEDCKWCKDYPTIHRIQNLSHEDMTKEYLFKHLPVIVTDAADDMAASKFINFEVLQQMYLEVEIFEDCFDCKFASSVRETEMRSFLENIFNYDSFSSHWSNCNFQCMKAFRKFYPRPYFIPPMVGTSDENFVIIGQKIEKSETDERSHIQPFLASNSMTWLTQIRGQFLITVYSECGCHTKEIMLQEGETLALNNKVWWFSYEAIGEGETIALGSSGSWA